MTDVESKPRKFRASIFPGSRQKSSIFGSKAGTQYIDFSDLNSKIQIVR